MIKVEYGEKELAQTKMKIPFLTRCWQSGLPSPEREYKFLPNRKFRIDFFFKKYRLAVECEGGGWMKRKTGHTSGVGFHSNMEKYNLLTLNGIWLLRFTPQEMTDGTAIESIVKFIKNELDSNFKPKTPDF